MEEDSIRLFSTRIQVGFRPGKVAVHAEEIEYWTTDVSSIQDTEKKFHRKGASPVDRELVP
jgi:hypothetical protein